MPCLKFRSCDWTVPAKLLIGWGAVINGNPAEITHGLNAGFEYGFDGNAGVPQMPGAKLNCPDSKKNGGLSHNPCPPWFQDESWKMAYPPRSAVFGLPSTFQANPIRGSN